LEGAVVSFTYNVILMSSLDLFVTGTIGDVALATSNTTFYTPSQNGYAPAMIVVQRDEDGTPDGGFFTISLNRATLVTSILYYPNGAVGTLASNSWTMQPDTCVHNVYPE
jgi:hypothetical protein